MVSSGRHHLRRSLRIELLEDRLLLAANDLPYYFNDPSGGAASNAQTIVVENTNDVEFVLTARSLTISGGHAREFSIVVRPSLPVVIPAGGTFQVDIVFDPSSNGVKVSQLVVQTGIPASPEITVDLRGLGHSSFGGSGEPPLDQIVELYQIPIDIGFTSLTTPYSEALLGDEVLLPLLTKAGPGDVIIEPLAAFGPSSNPDYRIGWYLPGERPDLTFLFDAETLNPVPGGDAQTVNVIIEAGVTNFDPGSATFGLFGEFPAFNNRHVFTEDALNTFNLGRRKIRFWPLKDEAGVLVPNAYLIGLEEANNNDLNDVVFIVRNVTVPVELASDFTNNGFVNGADFLTWQRGFGITAPNASKADGDADNDLDVDSADFAIWESEFGLMATPAVATTALLSPVAINVASQSGDPSVPEIDLGQTETVAQMSTLPISLPSTQTVLPARTVFAKLLTNQSRRTPDQTQDGREVDRVLDPANIDFVYAQLTDRADALPTNGALQTMEETTEAVDDLFSKVDGFLTWRQIRRLFRS